MKKLNYLFTLLLALVICGNTWGANVVYIGVSGSATPGGAALKTTWLAAMQAAQAGDTIRFVSDMAGTKKFTGSNYISQAGTGVDKNNIVVDIQGYTIENSHSNVFSTKGANSNMTIIGNGGTLKNTSYTSTTTDNFAVRFFSGSNQTVSLKGQMNLIGDFGVYISDGGAYTNRTLNVGKDISTKLQTHTTKMAKSGLVVNNEGTLEINDKASSGFSTITNSGTMNITKASLTNATTITNTGALTIGADVTVTNSVLNNNAGATSLSLNGGTYTTLTTPSGILLTITGGVFKGGSIDANVAAGSVVTGGSFANTMITSSTLDAWKTSGVIPTGYDYEISGSTYTVSEIKNVAKIGQEEYLSLTSAINAVQSGQTIELLENITNPGEYDISGKNFSISGAKTITSPTFLVNSAATLTLASGTTMTNMTTSGSKPLTFNNNGTVTLTGGKYTNNVSATIVSGKEKFQVGDVYYVGKTVANAVAFVSSNETRYTAFDAAVKAAEAGATVTLLADNVNIGALKAANNVTQSLVFDLNNKTLKVSASDGYIQFNGASEVTFKNGTIRNDIASTWQCIKFFNGQRLIFDNVSVINTKTNSTGAVGAAIAIGNEDSNNYELVLKGTSSLSGSLFQIYSRTTGTITIKNYTDGLSNASKSIIGISKVPALAVENYGTFTYTQKENVSSFSLVNDANATAYIGTGTYTQHIDGTLHISGGIFLASAFTQQEITSAVVSGKSVYPTGYNGQDAYRVADTGLSPVAKVGSTDYYYTLADAFNSVGYGATATIQLTTHTTLNERVVLNNQQNITLDMNNFNITAYKQIEVRNAALHLAGNGTYNCTLVSDVKDWWNEPFSFYGSEVYKEDYGYCTFTVGANVTIEAGSRYIFHVYNGSYPDANWRSSVGYGMAEGVTIDIYGTLSGHISINGYAYNQGGEKYPVTDMFIDGNVPVITIHSDASVGNADCGSAIYAAGYGKWVIEGTVTGQNGIYAKSGQLIINGGTVLGVGEHAEPQPSGTGYYTTGDAITMDSKTYYAGSMLLEATDATITSTNGYGVRECVTKNDATETDHIYLTDCHVSGGHGDVYADTKVVITTTEADNIVNVTLGTTMTFAKGSDVTTLAIKSTPGISGQIFNADSAQAQTVYIDITMNTTGTMDNTLWYGISVPFNVNSRDNIYRINSAGEVSKATQNVNYVLYKFDGAARATTGQGWSALPIGATLTPGNFYMMIFDVDDYNEYRFQADDPKKIDFNNDIQLNTYAQTTGNIIDANWNAVANPKLHYVNIDGEENFSKVQAYNSTLNKYDQCDLEDYSFVVGTPFFIQIADASTLLYETAGANQHDILRAPIRTAETTNRYVMQLMQSAVEVDNIEVRASSDYLDEYQLGKDVAKAFGEGESKVARMWVNAYSSKLSTNYAPLVNDSAKFSLGFSAPAAADYVLHLKKIATDGSQLYLYKDGSRINTMNADDYTISLAKGETTGYSLLIVKTSTPTSIENIVSGVEFAPQGKFLIDGKLYIEQNGVLYDACGNCVK